MKRIKTVQRNRLNTNTLDHLIRVSMEGPTMEEWDPLPALRLWESWENRKIETSNTTSDNKLSYHCLLLTVTFCIAHVSKYQLTKLLFPILY